MLNVNMICSRCDAKARRAIHDGVWSVGCRGVHEAPSESAKCPNGHGFMIREDGRETVDQIEAKMRSREMLERVKTQIEKFPREHLSYDIRCELEKLESLPSRNKI